MAQQIKKKFIQDDAVDGQKLKLQKDQSVRGQKQDGSEVELLKLDGSDKLVSDGKEVGFKVDIESEKSRAEGEESRIEGKVDQEVSDRQSEVSRVEELISDEEEARIQGDLDLQSQVNTEKGRIDAILLASDADKDSFAEIVQLINSVDTENDSAFGSYVISNNQALANEISARQSADEDLQTAIDQEESRAMAAELAEQTARQNADEDLQAQHDDLDGYAQDIRGDLDQEILDRQSGDFSLRTDLNSEISRAQAAELAEQTARIAADLQLQTSLDQEISGRQADVDAEENRAIGEESRIEGKVDQEVSDRATAVLEERTARIAGDQSLQDQVDVEKGRVDAILSASQADKDSFAEIVELINSIDTENDSAFGSYVLSNNQALEDEKSARESADEDLQTAIEQEESRAMGVEQELQTSLDQEISDRQTAIEDLGTLVDGNFIYRNADFRTEGEESLNGLYKGTFSLKMKDSLNPSLDKVTVDHQGISISDPAIGSSSFKLNYMQLNNEQGGATHLTPGSGFMKARNSANPDDMHWLYFDRMDAGQVVLETESFSETEGSTISPSMPTMPSSLVVKAYVDQQDSALSVRISAIEAQTDGPFFEKQKVVIDEASELSSIELSHECMENSLVVCVGRLMVHKDEDYSVSVVDGKTVLTWMGDFAQGGSEGIESGDVIFVTFARSM